MGGRELDFAISFFLLARFFLSFFPFSNGIGVSKLPLWGARCVFQRLLFDYFVM